MLSYNDLHWCSDWNGYEVGYDNVPVVGLYSLRVSPNVYFYIDTENETILEAWGIEEDE